MTHTRRHRRTKFSHLLMEALESRQLMSTAAPLTSPIPAEPWMPLGNTTVNLSPHLFEMPGQAVAEPLLTMTSDDSRIFMISTESDTVVRLIVSATINWGDGSANSSATFERNDQGLIEVFGDHTYTATGTYNLAIKITGTRGTLAGYQGPPPTDPPAVVQDGIYFRQVVVDASDHAPSTPIAAAIPVPTNPVAEIYNGDVIAIVNTPVNTLKTLSADDSQRFMLKSELTGNAQGAVLFGTINWGDGTTSDALFRRDSRGLIEIYGDHSYAASGQFSATLNISSRVDVSSHYSGPPLGLPDVILIVSNNEPVNVRVFPSFAVPGSNNVLINSTFTMQLRSLSFNRSLDFTLPNILPSDFTGTIDWGDGSSSAAQFLNSQDDAIILFGTHT